MEPLRLELNEAISLKLKDASQTVKDKVEQYHAELVSHLREFYAHKKQELEDYAEQQLLEAKRQREREAMAQSNKNVKSIVKRRQSSSEKRVSFSESPPHVELFKKLEDHEYGEDDNFVETDDNEECYTPDTLKAESASPDITPTVSPEVQLGSSNSQHDRLTRPVKLIMPSTAAAATTNASRNSGHHSDEADNTEDDLFDFEDVIEDPPATEDSPAQSALEHNAGRSPDLVPEQEDQSDYNYPQRINDDGIVGSAPVKIKSSPWGYEADGGPPPKSEKLKRLEDAEALSISLSAQGLPQSPNISQMSFSQRQEWEKLLKQRKSGIV